MKEGKEREREIFLETKHVEGEKEEEKEVREGEEGGRECWMLYIPRCLQESICSLFVFPA